MKITQTSSFWAFVVCLVLSILVGQLHWILGVIFFFLLASKTFFIAFLADMAQGMLEYHNDRADERTKKSFESVAHIANKLIKK